MSPFTHSAGGIVLNRRGQVLVVSQRDKTWSLPKGHMKEGEDPRETARREIIEESGLASVQFVRILKSYTRFTITRTGREDPASLKRITMYLFWTEEEELRPMDPRNPEARWVDRADVAALLSHPRDQDFFVQMLPELEEFLAAASSSR